jgi:hypothetical protein
MQIKAKKFLFLILTIINLICFKSYLNSQSIISNSMLVKNGDYYELSEEGLEFYRKNLLISVDLTGSIYFPPIYHQTHWVCNQVSASYYMMTYETNLAKGISSQNPDNVFSVYFPWNFNNGGNGWYGGHYILTMEMLKKFGVLLLHRSPADISRDSSLWASGYELYYEAMHNRIKDYYLIKTNTEAGIITLKSWIYNHSGSSNMGGLATFMANIAQNGDAYLPQGTPHAGEYVITKCGNDALHARTLVGYDDNICFDYNGDGQYTNNIDLNGDGIIDVRDWEKGAFKFAESNGPNWQGNGCGWIMYKTFAEAYGSGGILNNSVHIIEPNIGYKPLLTAKVKISHPSREAVKIMIGISSDTTANEPEYISDFPIFNFQGGNKFMQGGTSEQDKTIEFGLDLTEFLQYFNSNNTAKFFITFYEYDPNNLFNGKIESFSLIDYTGNIPFQKNYHPTPLDFVNNSKTTITMTLKINENYAPKILSNSIPIQNENENIWYQLHAQGGTPPYKWEIITYYDIETQTQEYQSFTGTKLTPNEYFDGELSLNLNFDFPINNFYTNKIKVHTNGIILPNHNTTHWTQFFHLVYPMFINELMIAPFFRCNFVCDHSKGQGIWYQNNSNNVKIRWKVSELWAEQWTNAEFMATLYNDGKIEFQYGPQSLKKKYPDLGGVSFGYKNNHILCFLNDIPQPGTKYVITPYPKPTTININQDGVIYGNVMNHYEYPISVKITDANNISDVRTFYLYTGIKNYDKNEISIFPNPAKDFIIISIKNVDQNFQFDYEYIIYNLNSTPIKSGRISGGSSNMINTSALPAGKYILKIENKEETILFNFIKV